ncbi:hypothetical protein AAG612_09935 [Citromicrobium bathyomarinum]|uniref:hypothetical protein n=1 Tax=Citromicrobium bathyomarinum TaxID=72174 RepID=UPI00315B27A3
MPRFEEAQGIFEERINGFDLCGGKTARYSEVNGTNGFGDRSSFVYPAPALIFEDHPCGIFADRELASALLNRCDLMIVQAKMKYVAGHFTSLPMREGKAAEQHKVYTPCILRKYKGYSGA